jgi:energy-coupling factor transporter ATP-binding protein EcfA2
MADGMYPRMGWEQFLKRLKIKQGEHVTVIKPTGGGKSTLMSAILPAHTVKTQVVLVTKTYDETFDKYFSRKDGWYRAEDWASVPRWENKILLWPRIAKSGMTLRDYMSIQKRVFTDAINVIGVQRGWSVICDEEQYLCEHLGLTYEVKWLHHQGRSSGITAFTGIQRPKFVPVITYSSATHAFIGNTTDRDDLKRLTDLGGVESKKLAFNAARLGYYDFLYVPARNPNMSPVIVNTRK